MSSKTKIVVLRMILNTQSTKDLTFPESSRYTCMTLLKAVDNALEKARE